MSHSINPDTASEVPLITELLKDIEALVDQKTGARILGLSNHKTLAVWRCNGTHPDLLFRKVGGRAVRYRVGDLISFRDRDINRPP